VNSITTLQGLEYATSLISLTLDGYDLSGYINSNAEYDKLVVQILAKAVTSGTIDSGLRILSASGCGLSAISDVLDLTPIASGDSTTDQFKLTSLDLSNNSISDVSVLITSSISPGDSLTSLNINGNSICDINSVVMSFQSYFTNLTTLTASNQSTCPCSESGADVSFFAHKTCRQRSDGDYQVECWHGYYLDKNTNTCIKACTSGYSVNPSDITGETCAEDLGVEDDNVIRCQVCERKEDVVAIYDSVSSSVLCASPCLSGWYGDDCSSECPIVGGEVCSGHGSCNTTDHACECDTWYDDASCSTLVPVYSPECDRTFTIDDHLECNEVYPGRYAAECEDGYYYDEANYSCYAEDATYVCPSINDDYHMCVLVDGDTTPTAECRSAWYGDDCDQLYSVHIPDKLFRGKVCDYAGYDITVDPLCDVTEFEMAGISGYIYSFNSHITSFEGAQNVGLSEMYIANTYDSAFIPLCRSEDNTDYWTFITTVFPFHESDNKEIYFIPNSCPLNTDPGNSPYNCNTSNASCPSIVLNEVFNSVDGVNEKQCAFIAKSSDGKCYTVHDDLIREYLIANCLPNGNVDLESNGIISVPTMRGLTCSSSSLSLSSVIKIAYSSITTVNNITTLQGLEYATSLTSLTLDGYDLSGDINSNAEYDKLVVQILAKAVTYAPIDSGLRILSASGCGLSAISDVLDLTPIASGDSTTDQFKLTSLDLSNNSISDVSVLITESIFPNNFLTTLDISDNNICDIEGMVDELETYFSTGISITYSDQTCHCSASVSSAAHQVCREVYPDRWAVECWNGYYLDKASGE
ncbi:Acidic leucine-rich nuclear phosphoprotein 32 like protein, partial [Aduncisulcus paluster]